MPRTIRRIEFLTSQEWMQLGYPVFVTSALENYNAMTAEDGDKHEIVTPAMFAAKSPKEQLDFALHWEGILGYTSYIWEAVNRLVALEKAKRLLGKLRSSPFGWKPADFQLALESEGFSEVEAMQLVSWLLPAEKED